MSSLAPTTPTPTPKTTRTPSTSVKSTKKRKRVEDASMTSPGGTDEEGSGGDTPVGPLAIVNKDLASHFGEDATWYGSNYFASISSSEGRLKASQSLFLWLVFATALDHSPHFGPKNAYNYRVAQFACDFVIEQFGVRPLHVNHVPSGGKSYRYLLTFDGGDRKRLMKKIPRGWIKLARGLACRLSSPTDVYRSPFPVTITRVPEFIPLSSIKKALEREPFVGKLTELQRVTLGNGVKTERVDGMILLNDSVDPAPFNKGQLDISYSFLVEGVTLLLGRRWFCTTCGDEAHIWYECPVRTKVLDAKEKGWAYCTTDDAEEPQAQTEGASLASVGSGSGGVAIEVPVEGSVPMEEVSKVVGAGNGKKSRRRATKKKKGEEMGPPAKKAKV